MIPFTNYNRKDELDTHIEEMTMNILTGVLWKISPVISDLEFGDMVTIDTLFPPDEWIGYSDDVRERYRGYVKQLIQRGMVPLNYIVSNAYPQGAVFKL